MSSGRRKFLGYAAASLVGLVCLRGSFVENISKTRDRNASDSDLGRAARFPGDPGDGNVLYGASLPWNSSILSFEQTVGRHLGVHRSYFTANQSSELISTVRDDHAYGRLSLASTKCPGSWTEVANGEFDGWLEGLLRQLGDEGFPIMLALHHEPENDVSADLRPDGWVAMQQRAIRLALTLAPAVTIVPILMQYTFDPASGRDPHIWMVPDCDVFGVDVYNHWSESNGSAWTDISAQLDTALPWASGKPIIVAEYGCRTDSQQPGRAAAWMDSAYEYAQSHDIPVLSYFDSWQNSPDGTWELGGERLVAFTQLLARSYDASTDSGG